MFLIGMLLDNNIRQIWIEKEEPYRIIKASYKD